MSNKPLLYRTWAGNGIEIVNNLFDINGNWVSYTKMQQMYGVNIAQLSYYGMISAIPKSKNMEKN